MKIFQLMGAKGAGGAELFYVRLMQRLHADDRVDVVPIVRKKSWAAQQLTERNIPHKTLTFGGWWDMWSKPQLAKFIEWEAPDAMIAWMNRAGRILPSVGVPTAARLGGYYKLKNYKHADVLVGNTQDIVDYCVKEGWPKDKTAYLPNFTELPTHLSDAQKAEIKANYGIIDADYVCLLAGRLHENKAFDTAIAALPLLPKHVKYILAGQGKLQKQLHQQAEALGVAKQLIWAGWVDDISPLAQIANCWLIPSRHEPLGNTVLDAWAHTLPVVAAKSSGPASLIQHGQTGFLHAVDDAAALAKELKKCIDYPKQTTELTEKGHTHFLQHFSPESVVDQYITFFEKLIKETK